MCIKLALKKSFLCFWRVFVSCASCSRVFRLITVPSLVSGAPVVICISGNFFFGVKTGKARFCVPACSTCACARWREMAIKRTVWCRDCVRSEREVSGRQLRGQHTGVDGVLLMQVPNSTSARGVLCSIHLYLRLRGAFAANPPTSITPLIS